MQVLLAEQDVLAHAQMRESGPGLDLSLQPLARHPEPLSRLLVVAVRDVLAHATSPHIFSTWLTARPVRRAASSTVTPSSFNSTNVSLNEDPAPCTSKLSSRFTAVRNRRPSR